MNDFSDLLARSVFTLRLPQFSDTDSAVDGGGHGSGGYRAVVFDQLHTDTVDGRDLVGSRRRVTVSCCLCPQALRLSASGYGEMARRVEAAGWHYTPGRHLHDRAWCPECRPNAGSAVD